MIFKNDIGKVKIGGSIVVDEDIVMQYCTVSNGKKDINHLELIAGNHHFNSVFKLTKGKRLDKLIDDLLKGSEWLEDPIGFETRAPDKREAKPNVYSHTYHSRVRAIEREIEEEDSNYSQAYYEGMKRALAILNGEE